MKTLEQITEEMKKSKMNYFYNRFIQKENYA